jgi:hypothetical protein
VPDKTDLEAKEVGEWTMDKEQTYYGHNPQVVELDGTVSRFTHSIWTNATLCTTTIFLAFAIKDCLDGDLL